MYAGIHQDLQSQLDNRLVSDQLGMSVPKKNPTDRLCEAVETLRKARSEVLSATGRLLGEGEGDGGSDGDRPVPAGVAGYIEYCADEINELAGEIGRAAARINSRF